MSKFQGLSVSPIGLLPIFLFTSGFFLLVMLVSYATLRNTRNDMRDFQENLFAICEARLLFVVEMLVSVKLETEISTETLSKINVLSGEIRNEATSLGEKIKIENKFLPLLNEVRNALNVSLSKENLAKLQDLDKQILKNKQGYIHYYEAYNKMVNNIPSKFAAKMFGYKKIA